MRTAEAQFNHYDPKYRCCCGIMHVKVSVLHRQYITLLLLDYFIIYHFFETNIEFFAFFINDKKF